MEISAIKTFSNFHAYLTEDCETTSAGGTQVKVSTSDATALSTWASHFDSDSCRLLVGNFATYDSQYYAFETALVSSIDTGTGVITFTGALSGKANYTTAKSSRVSISVCVDGDCECYF